MPTPSHIYEVTLRDMARLLVLPLLPLAVFALAMHLGARANLLPPPVPILDADRTILLHQAEATRQRHGADLVLIGDSSCLMNVGANQLSALLPGSPATLNLGTLSYLDLNAFRTILSRYLASNAEPPSQVVLLMHPEALRRLSPTEYHVEVLEYFYANSDYCSPALPQFFCLTGMEIFRGRLLARALPHPLPGALGRRYGFTHNLWNYMSAHRGSALDPGEFDPANTPGDFDFRLAASLERKSRAFRSVLPESTHLAVGICPVPESLAPAGFDKERDQMLQTWSSWLAADLPLHGMPSVFPDEFFASPTHLNEAGVALYTSRLAAALSRRIPVPK